MNIHIVLLSAFSLLLCACGNRGDLILSSQSPPEDAGRYLIKPKPAAETIEAIPEAGSESGDDDD